MYKTVFVPTIIYGVLHAQPKSKVQHNIHRNEGFKKIEGDLKTVPVDKYRNKK